MTGQLLTGSTLLDHAAVAVKVSDVASAHPQAGVNAADIVFVEPNGISYTRLCAVFHSRFPELVGRVRSIRPVDVPLLSPIKPVFRQHRSCPLGDALDGSPLKIPPGRTFMELPQINAGVRFT